MSKYSSIYLFSAALYRLMCVLVKSVLFSPWHSILLSGFLRLSLCSMTLSRMLFSQTLSHPKQYNLNQFHNTKLCKALFWWELIYWMFFSLVWFRWLSSCWESNCQMSFCWVQSKILLSSPLLNVILSRVKMLGVALVKWQSASLLSTVLQYAVAILPTDL